VDVLLHRGFQSDQSALCKLLLKSVPIECPSLAKKLFTRGKQPRVMSYKYPHANVRDPFDGAHNSQVAMGGRVIETQIAWRVEGKHSPLPVNSCGALSSTFEHEELL
jgi:hypothetical protein